MGKKGMNMIDRNNPNWENQDAERTSNQQEEQEKHADFHAAPDQDIAIIGLSCCYPGAENCDEYWNNLINGINLIGVLPTKRQNDMEIMLAGKGPHMDYDNVKGGFLTQIDMFDAAFFSIPPNEAIAMDPRQRKFLQVAYTAFEDAGYGGRSLAGTDTAVFVGADNSAEPKYASLIDDWDMLSMVGTLAGMLASRISYFLDLKGPAVVMDTSCSSSLVALHHAVQALNSRQCGMALVGGASLYMYLSATNEGQGVENDTNIIRVFDKQSNGLVWGEGFGAVVIRRLQDALADRDTIHAVIKSSAINFPAASCGVFSG
jgi:acyl transferase domain-containing protein